MTLINEEEIKKTFLKKIIPSLMESCAKEVVKIMKHHLEDDGTISTTTMQECVRTFKESDSTISIGVDYDMVQSFAVEPTVKLDYVRGQYLVFGYFCNTFNGYGGDAYEQDWNGMPIAWNMAKWLEEGNKGFVGNNPISAGHWFTNAVEELKGSIRQIVIKNLTKLGIKTTN